VSDEGITTKTGLKKPVFVVSDAKDADLKAQPKQKGDADNGHGTERQQIQQGIHDIAQGQAFSGVHRFGHKNSFLTHFHPYCALKTKQRLCQKLANQRTSVIPPAKT
jgi:hypothetical protein